MRYARVGLRYAAREGGATLRCLTKYYRISAAHKRASPFAAFLVTRIWAVYHDPTAHLEDNGVLVIGDTDEAADR